MTGPFLLLLALVLVGCAQQPPPSPTEPVTLPVSTVVGPTLSTLAPVASPTAPATLVAPTPPDPPPAVGQGGPAAPNESVITARLVRIESDPDNASQVRLVVIILTSAPAGADLDFTAGLIGKNATLVARKQDMPDLSAGDVFAAHVVFTGDEQRGIYHASSIKKTAR